MMILMSFDWNIGSRNKNSFLQVQGTLKLQTVLLILKRMEGQEGWIELLGPGLSRHLSVPITVRPTPSLPRHGHSHNESICLVWRSCLPLVSRTLLWKVKPCCPWSHWNYKPNPHVWVRSSVDVLRVQSVLGAKLKPGVYFNFMAPHHTFIFVWNCGRCLVHLLLQVLA